MARASRKPAVAVRRLCVVLGDQLDQRSAVFDGFDNGQDLVLMMEVAAESRHVPSHAQRTVLFLSAMRHFANELESRGVRVRYVHLDDPANTQTLGGEIERAIRAVRPDSIRLVVPGEHRVEKMIRACSDRAGVRVELLPDRHFLTSDEQFAAWADGRKPPLVMEFFYREQRRRLNVLMEPDGTPVGGEWNLDKMNRRSFGARGPNPPAVPMFDPDAITRSVMKAVRDRLPELPGKMEPFGWPVTRTQALECLRDFVTHRLHDFGPFEDAMWTDEPFLYHSALSPALNLKLLDPRECIESAVAAYVDGGAPLQSVEGYVRQIIGWREFVRGVYRLEGPEYAERNFLGHGGDLPPVYWTGRTEMVCMRECVGQVLDRAYAHHIPRLMVMGNFALMLGVHPKRVSDWYLGMFADGVDWVTLPNVLGMSQHADARPSQRGGLPLVGTKPYVSGGAYIRKMSNYCSSCEYDPTKRTGPGACPFSTLYWEFLIRHEDRLRRNPRMSLAIKNLDGLSAAQRAEITISAKSVRGRAMSGRI